MSPVQLNPAIQFLERQDDARSRAAADPFGKAEATSPAPAIGPPATDFGGTGWLMHRLGNRWTVPIIGALRHGPVRFAQLKRRLGSVSQRMLTLSLRRLEHDGLIYREEIAGQPPQVRYGLTPFGDGLVERLQSIECWLASQGRVSIAV